ncbi:T9SS type B sorting domain-containing protein [Aquimarina pacifica]|uniref:T9SS type B sorting domain-containing protein n=1 Tax=Aquimarina pacifica TaxID=1296415 RepID=UPI00046EEB6E|nr:T9SS type B sorting domain-containing protein [Aquimarina pacifica]
MVKVRPQIFFFLFLLIGCSTLFAQDDLECRISSPFCSDEARELTFNNTISDLDGHGEVGCLNTSPNPAWYYLRIDEPGELIFDIQQWVDTDDDSRLDSSERQLDVDFIAWGPFTTFYVDCDILSQGCDLNGDTENIRPAECENNADFPFFYYEDQDNTNIVDCSYARTPIENEETIYTETFTIPNAQSGEYYIILMTNFADESGVIQLQQTNLDEPGAGTTDCSILDEGLPDNIATCGVIPTLIQGRFDGAVTYQWYVQNGAGTFDPIAGEVAPFYEAPVPGTYRLEGFTGAGSSAGFDDIVIADVSGAVLDGTVIGVVTEESFSGSYTVTAEFEAQQALVNAEFTDFEFSLFRYDASLGLGEYRIYRELQTSPIFENVPPGDYYVVARYADCEESEVQSEPFMIVGYPKYFTPNGDSFHPTWNVINLEDQTATALIFIFDRYGKLLKQIRSDGEGWDGTYNGKNMPSADYWFRVEFNEPTDPNFRRRVVTGNFSLIR